ncbi:endonuclease/exonuclease/phosphatase family protein [Chryseobacterium sp.]|uniref:endonuclease/exonuclease/phosphatase family protein n=1 Tax=Chryseobacterium sp. TaxID=1871047 RepID=UPI0025B94D90|nr:endonuclease/exonuclease/phosphatase family protein [Chryseobacterium sp.]
MKIFRLILFFLHIGIGVLLLGTLLNAYVPPKIFPWVNLLSLGFPVLIIAYVLLTLFWIFSWKKRAVIFVILGLALITPAKRWVNYSSTPKESSNLKLVTFNVKGGNAGKTNIENYINSQNADVVMFEEDGMKEFDFKGLKGGKKMQNVSLYTKHTIIDQKDLIIGDYEWFNAYAQQTDLEIRGKRYRFVVVYLQPFKFEKSMIKLYGNNSGEDEEKVKNILKRLIPTFKAHQEQVEIIRKAIDDSPYPVFVAGDFNSVPNSYEYYHLLEGLKDPFLEIGKGSGTSFHDYKFPIRIDYIFTSKNIKPISYQVDRTVDLSDHFPVIGTFRLDH